jgi:zinc/manganese transport system substrate-binding protein
VGAARIAAARGRRLSDMARALIRAAAALPHGAAPTAFLERRRWLQRLALAGAAGAWAVSRPARAAEPAPLSVMASFSILADMTREVAGPWAQVGSMVAANADAHGFQPTPADVQRLARADLVIVNGLRFEGWLDRLVASAGYRGVVVSASDGVEVRRVGPVADPHAWQSLQRARRYVDNIANGLVAAARDRLPPGAAAALESGVQQRASAYAVRLDELDTRIRGWFAAIPRDSRRVITAHGAFGYFGDDYGITFTALGGWSTGGEASAASVARLVRQVRAQRVTALFAENISDRRLLMRVAEETGAALGGVLYSDALGPAGGPADTYLKLVEHNARTIVQALQAADAAPAVRS